MSTRNEPLSVRAALLPALLVLILTTTSVTADTAAYFISTNAETMSRIDLNTGVVTPDVITLGSDVGSAPNQLVIRDTAAYMVASVTDEIQVINLNTMTTTGYIDLPTGSNPYWMEFYDTRYLWVSLLVDNAVAKIDAVTGSVVGQVPVGKSPQGIAIYDHKLYVANTGFDFGTFLYDPGSVSVIDLRGDSVLATIPVGLNAQFMSVDQSGRVHVVCTGDFLSVFGVVYVIDPANDTVVDSIPLGGSPGQIEIGPNEVAYIAAGGFTDSGLVYTYNSLTGEVFHDNSNPLKVDFGALGMGIFQDGSAFALTFNNTVVRIDSSGTYLDAWAASDGPAHIDFGYFTGDVTGDFTVDISDITRLVDFLFLSFSPPRWPMWRANTNGDFTIDISDLTKLVNHLFVTNEPLVSGPRWLR